MTSAVADSSSEFLATGFEICSDEVLAQKASGTEQILKRRYQVLVLRLEYDPNNKRSLGLSITMEHATKQVLVRTALPDCLAAAAGLRVNDILVAVDQEAVLNKIQARQLIITSLHSKGSIDLLIHRPYPAIQQTSKQRSTHERPQSTKPNKQTRNAFSPIPMPSDVKKFTIEHRRKIKERRLKPQSGILRTRESLGNCDRSISVDENDEESCDDIPLTTACSISFHSQHEDVFIASDVPKGKRLKRHRDKSNNVLVRGKEDATPIIKDMHHRL